MIKAIMNYFSEFKILKDASRDFWLINAIQSCDGLAYFSMILSFSLYLTINCGFNDIDSGAWVGIFTLYITAFVFAVGSICDTIGLRKSLFIGLALLTVSRLALGLTPVYLEGESLQWAVKGAIIVMALGTAFMGPVIQAGLRRFTSKKTRATGFNVFYLLMNISAIVATAIVLDGCRKGFPSLAAKLDGVLPAAVVGFLDGGFGEVNGNLAILIFGFVMSVIALLLSSFLNEDNYAEESERVTNIDPNRRPLAIFMEVWKEKPFQKLLLLLILTIGVRMVFVNQFLVMPKYYTRLLYSDFELGLANSLNPAIIVVGLIVLIPVINRFSTIKLIIVGMAVSAFSLVVLAVPIQWVLAIPGVTTLTEAYVLIIVLQIVIFAFGELIFNPRFMEYVASIAPQDKVTSYMALSALPMFIAKPINGFVSGMLIYRYCYDGIRPKIETGNVPYVDSPEFMWMIYLVIAVMSPIAVWALRNYFASTAPATDRSKLQNEGDVA
jgi:POT family proton-dependent oligopeptide transporter